MARSQQFVIFLLGLLHFYLLLPTPNPLIPQPKAKRKATSYTVANTTFHDDYLYLSDKLDPYVIEYITSENE